MSDVFEIETERLILRHPTLEDAQIITGAKKDVWRELQTWMTWAFDGQETLESTKDFIEYLGPHALAGFCKDTKDLVVLTGLTPQKPDEYETGYWVAKDYLGKGFATEGTAAAIRYGFEMLQAKVIHIGYYEGNEKSRRVIEKLGFDNEIVVKNARHAILGGALQDSHEFTMTNGNHLKDIECQWRGRW